MNFFNNIDDWTEQKLREDKIYYDDYIEYSEILKILKRIDNYNINNKFKYIDYINQGGVEPTYIDYHDIVLICDRDKYLIYYDNNVQYYLNKYIELNSKQLINNIKSYLYDLIYLIKYSTIIIQKAFRKYRYDPQYKFCKLVQTRNLLLDNIISKEEFLNFNNK